MIQNGGCTIARAYFLWLALLPLTPCVVRGQNSTPVPKHSITPADAVEMTRVVYDDFGANSIKKPAYFSPDGTRFVVVLTKGNRDQDTNDFFLLLYETAEAPRAPKADLLLKKSSSSGRDAIRQLRWLADNDTLVFLGEDPGGVSQVYSFQISTRKLKKLTHHPTAVFTYNITEDGHVFAFVADPPKTKMADSEEHGPAREMVVEGQELDQIVAGDYSLPQGQQIYWQQTGSSPHLVPVERGYYPNRGPFFLSPDGRYVLFSTNLGSDRIRPEWSGYRDEIMQQMLAANHRITAITGLRQYVLFDSQNMSSALLIDAPIFGGGPVFWSSNAKSIFLTSYLPLDSSDPGELRDRKQAKFPIEVTLPGKQYRRVAKEDFPLKRINEPPIEVTLDQDLNTPPKLYVTDARSHQKVLLLDLNPQFNELDFGRVETIQWEVNGAKIIGGLYLPPDYEPGKRYPLVIQTHGFDPTEFSMDGLSGWSSGFAARSLAARGIMVLQAHKFKDYQKDHDHIGDDKSLGMTAQESFKNFNTLVYQAAIDFLDKKGMIDRNRVGIVGFSRTVCSVAYTLTHSKYRFAAASLVDGIGCGYFEEMTTPGLAWDSNAFNGGVAPFGEGLKMWIKTSPGFNLDKVETPVRLVALRQSNVLGDLWQFYVGLSLQKKPVDFVVIPDGSHIYGKASECILKQEGLVDWFTFWLKSEEDPKSTKTEQYARWRELRREAMALFATAK